MSGHPIPRFEGRVDGEGHIVLEQRDDWRKYLRTLAGRTVWVTVEVLRKRRTLSQNAYLFGVVYHYIGLWSGHTGQEGREIIHAAMKEKYCPKKELVLPTGEVLEVRSTRLLSTAEFSEFTDHVIAWAHESGAGYIPQPNEVTVHDQAVT